MGRLDELKKQVAELEAQAKVQQNQPLGTTDQAAPAVESDEEQVRRVFNAILGLDGAEERQAIEDRNMRVCSSCFLPQPKTNTVCELCGNSAGWLVPSEARKNAESDMFVRMAADYTVEQLNTALRSGWATTPQRERVARLLLVSREARSVRQNQDSHAECADENEQPSVLDGIDIGLVATGYDRALDEIDAKLSQLKSELKAEQSQESLQ